MSTTALQSPIEYASVWDSLTLKSGLNKQIIASNEEFKKLSTKLTSTLDINERPIPRNKLIGLVFVVVVAHAFGIDGFISALSQPSIIKKEKSEVLIEFIKPIVEPLPAIDPPKPPPPPPPQVKRTEPPPQATPKPAELRTAPAEANILPSDINVKENTEAVKNTGPVVAEPVTPEPPPVIKEEPITEARGGVGHLNNPPPEYPEFAQRQGFEGTVTLRVRVLPSGAPVEVKVKKSSGKAMLDEAAVEAAKGWAFTPAKKGNTYVEGWATVPVVFKLE